MFTGIVEQLLPLTAVVPLDASAGGGGGYSMTIGAANAILDDCHIGDSIAVNGTCLTVTTFAYEPHSPSGGWFKVGIAPETLRKTNLGALRTGDRVNCERAMGAKTRFGGHFVQGHVDTTATLRSVTPVGNALTLVLRLNRSAELPRPSELSPYLIPKGYVTLDGASLTLIDVSAAEGGALDGGDTGREVVEFSVMLISHTQEMIGLSAKQAGEAVNVELDMVGKFVHRAVVGAAGRTGADADAEEEAAPDSTDARAVDAGAAHLRASGAGAQSSADALTALIERTVRKVLAEKAEK